MGHPQPPTLVMTDNSAAGGILNKTVKQKRTQAIDMRTTLLSIGDPGTENFGDYHTKHHSAAHHKCMCQYYLHTVEALAHYAMRMSPRDLRGCVESNGTDPRAHNPEGLPMTHPSGFR
eukprot:1809984-Ditylum_brightwellii.AAC.2